MPTRDVTHVESDAVRTKNGSGKQTAGIIAALGVACLACLIPGLAVGGAGIFAAGAIGVDQALLGAAALALLAYAITTTIRRRAAAAATSPSGDCDC